MVLQSCPFVVPPQNPWKMQRRAVIWILRVFKTSLTKGVEAMAGLIPIKAHLQKLGGRSQLHASFLPPNHII